MKFLAFDLGAESGRAVLGNLQDGQADPGGNLPLPE